MVQRAVCNSFTAGMEGQADNDADRCMLEFDDIGVLCMTEKR